MKNRYKTKHRIFGFLFAVFAFSLVFTSCKDEEPVVVPLEPTMELTASSTELQLSEDKIDDVALTLTWTTARDQGSDFSISYLTKFDAAENNFSNCILENQGDEVFTKSFTHGQLQKLLISKWNKKTNEYATMTFRVIGQLTGPKFIKPEVKTIIIRIKTYGPKVIQAAGLKMTGTAVPAGATLSQTIENQYCYAYYGALRAGSINFPINTDGTQVISPVAAGENAMDDGNAMDVRVKALAEAGSWTVPADGNYRVVVDLEKKTTTIYSAEKDIRPIKVLATTTATELTPVTSMWVYGEGTAWAWADANKMVQSVADPNIWTFNAKAISGRTKFTVGSVGASYAYSGTPNDATAVLDVAATLGTPLTVYGGTAANLRNSYIKVPAGTNLIILNLNTMTVLLNVQ